MKDLSTLRTEINAIDQQILELLSKRFQCSEGVAAYKKEKDIPVFDPEREKDLVENLQNIDSTLTRENIENIWGCIMSESRQQQSKYLDQ